MPFLIYVQRRHTYTSQKSFAILRPDHVHLCSSRLRRWHPLQRLSSNQRRGFSFNLNNYILRLNQTRLSPLNISLAIDLHFWWDRKFSNFSTTNKHAVALTVAWMSLYISNPENERHHRRSVELSSTKQTCRALTIILHKRLWAVVVSHSGLNPVTGNVLSIKFSYCKLLEIKKSAREWPSKETRMWTTISAVYLSAYCKLRPTYPYPKCSFSSNTHLGTEHSPYEASLYD